ncbi:sensor histidine kinase [Aquabacterium sp. OR-4]|uniref:sensor histidine kinase n=1 Tax=Aquabacterium sp. OR-4 TaxID=2978127 RepID=UPI0021B42DFE|nr:HAMP domain-containing sensor histidine kinase [Aquabacterium sp. OR-4]MDT7837964.1 HAMP domain-containing sensor histidine kinase [Aquabacterium sp. OR-4]
MHTAAGAAEAALLQALGEQGQALALLHGDTLGALNAPMRALLPGTAGESVARWAAALPGLPAALAAAPGPRWRCGSSGEYQAQRTALGDGRMLLRLDDERAHLHQLQRQLDDREGLLFTSRSLTVSEMGSVLAHELNQPIGATANLLRGLKLRVARRHPDDSDELAALDKALQQVSYASQIIGRVREYTQSRQPHAGPLDLVALVHQSLGLLDWDLQREALQLSLQLPATPVPVLADAVMLQQVLINLLRNALDALRLDRPAAPCIDITLAVADGRAELCVADNGPGITPQTEARLFLPFASTKPNGMGLGLSICRSLIEMHQGRLWFTRRASAGCCFHFALPLAATAPSPATPTPA